MLTQRILTAALVLGTCAVRAGSQERDSSSIHWRGGRPLDKDLADIPNDALPLHLAIEVPRKCVLAGENFPVRFVVTNHNRITLRFPGDGWTVPRLYASTTDEDLALFVDRSFGANAGEIGALTLAPGESASVTVIGVFPRSGAIARSLYAEIGYTLRLRGAGVVKTVAVDQTGCPEVVCKWESEEIQVPVHAPTAHERKAYQAMISWTERHRVPPPGVSRDDWTLATIEFYGKFLSDYGDTPYANQVRVQLLLELGEPVQKELKGIVYGEDGPTDNGLLALYVKTAIEIIDAGVPYASYVDRHVLEKLGMGRRWDMVATALEKLLEMSPSERTLDHTFATVAREYCDVIRPKAREHIGEAAQRIEGVVLPCISRCAAWEGFRAVPFDRRTFAFLSEMKRWGLLELTARRTLGAARLGQECGGQARFGRDVVAEETIAAAEEALLVSRRERNKQP